MFSLYDTFVIFLGNKTVGTDNTMVARGLRWVEGLTLEHGVCFALMELIVPCCFCDRVHMTCMFAKT